MPRTAPKRLCLFLNSWTYGGVEEHVTLLCQHLPALGYLPLVVCSDTDALRPWHDRLASLGVRRVSLSEGSGARDKLRFVGRLTQLLRRERVDVLHLQLIYFDGGRLPMLAGALARVPIVVTQHAAPREPVPFSKRATRSPFFVNVKRFVAVSRANQASQARYLRLPRERLTTIHNGIVVPPTCPDRAAARRRLHERLGLPEHVKLVGAVGRLTAQKGFDQLVRAAPAILQAEPNVRFAFAGDGPLRAELETHARSLGVHDSMLWLGFRSDVPELLSGFDVLAMPSVFEGLPLVLLEAFAAGCPAVANAVDGIPEIIDDGVNGFLTRPDDSTQLAERISEMLLDPERARRFSHAAHAKALKDFTVERMTRDTAALYDSVAVPEHG